MIIELNEKKFEDIIDFWKIILVDFWAPWCGPCKMMNPILDKLSKDFTILKVNIDTEIDLAAKYKVMCIPTILIFKDKRVVKSFVGVQQLAVLKTALKEFKVLAQLK